MSSLENYINCLSVVEKNRLYSFILPALFQYISIPPLVLVVVSYVCEPEKIWIWTLTSANTVSAFDPKEKRLQTYEIQGAGSLKASVMLKTLTGFVWSSRNGLTSGELNGENRIVIQTLSRTLSRSSGSMYSFVGAANEASADDAIIQLFTTPKKQTSDENILQLFTTPKKQTADEKILQLLRIPKKQTQENRMFQNGVWLTLPMSCSRNFERSAVYWNSLTWTLSIFGGYEKYPITLNTCSFMTKLSGEWKILPNFHVSRAEASATFHSASQSYLISGGWTYDSKTRSGLKSIEHFDSKSQKWSLLEMKLPVRLVSHHTQICGSQLLVFGGAVLFKNGLLKKLNQNVWTCKLTAEGYPHGDWVDVDCPALSCSLFI